MRRSVLAALAIIVLVGFVAAANLRRDPKSVVVDWQIIKPQAREVAIDSPARGPIVQTITAPGVVEPVEEAEIASQIVGRVVEVRVKDGDFVKKDDLLVKLDETNRKKLREFGLLTRDAREVERKKPGRSGARKRFQFSKR